MATWQFSVCLISGSWSRAHDGDVRLLYDDDGFDTSIAWSSVVAASSVFDEAFDKILARRKSWRPELIAWGSENGTDIQLSLEAGWVDEIQLRLNLMEDVEPFLSRFCQRLCGTDCMVFIPEMKKMVPLSPEAISQAAMSSSAAAFARDPGAYMAKLHDRYSASDPSDGP